MSGIAELLELERDVVLACVDALHAVVYTASDGRVFTFHASFPDFMQDKKRSRGYLQKFVKGVETREEVDMFCDIQMQHKFLVHHCFALMKKLCFNICDHPSSFQLDQHVDGLDERVKQRITEGLCYACQFWGAHLRFCEGHAMLNDVWTFLQEKLLFWFEAMNLVKKLADCGKILANVEQWCKVM